MTDVEAMTLALEKDPIGSLPWAALADALEEAGLDPSRTRAVSLMLSAHEARTPLVPNRSMSAFLDERVTHRWHAWARACLNPVHVVPAHDTLAIRRSGAGFIHARHAPSSFGKDDWAVLFPDGGDVFHSPDSTSPENFFLLVLGGRPMVLCHPALLPEIAGGEP